MATATRADLYSRVTARIVELLQQGVRPWLKPWNAQHAAGQITRPLRHQGQPYSGINVICLWLEAELKGFLSPYWLTYRQASELGGYVKKGEQGSLIVYADTFKKKELNDKGEEVEQDIPFLKEYIVFCADQCERLPEHFYQLAVPASEIVERIERAERFFANTQADIRYGGNRAYYSIAVDYIRLPPFETFRDAESHAATLAHELTHWTRHPSRLNRDLDRKRWGDEGYAAEELVAEIGAAFLCADLHLTPEVREDHASYIASWLKILKNDTRAVFTAASLASQAAGYLHSLQPQPDF